MDKTSDREDPGWHNLVASLDERYATCSKFKTTHHIVEDDCRNEQPLVDPVIVSSVKNINIVFVPFV
jgi:hypothetical protein